MKVVIPVAILLALALLIYNVTIIDYSDPFNGESTIALIGVVACACAIVLMLILRTSRKIAAKAGN